VWEAKLFDIYYTFAMDYLKESNYIFCFMRDCREKGNIKERTLALRDTIDLLGGKWKICILRNLSFGTMRFKDLQETVVGITPKVLSKELQDLEQNLLITRTVNNTKPVTVSYAITEHAKHVEPVIEALLDFGLIHREKIKQTAKITESLT